MYTVEHVLPANRNEEELANPHPVYRALVDDRMSQAFSRDETRHAVIPAYMGLVKQIDDQIGALLQFLEDRDQLNNTAIVFTSDHGDQLGDHWLGDKDSFYEESIRIPLIIVDPRSSADATRGTVCDELVESIDLVPTFLEMAGIQPDMNRLEGRSLVPLINGDTVEQWRDYVICELDYSYKSAREALKLPPMGCRAYMLRNKRWKYILYEGFSSQLFDLENDPQEITDLGSNTSYQHIRDQMKAEYFAWMRGRKRRVTITDEQIDQMFSGDSQLTRGIYLGFWSEKELPKQFRNSG
jgi:arylsulfatase A-like enzyme